MKPKFLSPMAHRIQNCFEAYELEVIEVYSRTAIGGVFLSYPRLHGSLLCEGCKSEAG